MKNPFRFFTKLALEEPPKEPIKVALVSSYALLRECFERRLTSEGFEVHLSVQTGAALIAGIDGARLPDIVLLDVSSRDADAESTTHCLTEKFPRVRTLVWMLDHHREVLERFIEAGAVGMLLKTEEPVRIKSILTGHYRGARKEFK